MFKTINHDRCLHCNSKIKEFNEEQFIEVVNDFSTMEKRYCCKKCFIKFYTINEGEEND